MTKNDQINSPTRSLSFPRNGPQLPFWHGLMTMPIVCCHLSSPIPEPWCYFFMSVFLFLALNLVLVHLELSIFLCLSIRFPRKFHSINEQLSRLFIMALNNLMSCYIKYLLPLYTSHSFQISSFSTIVLAYTRVGFCKKKMRH